MATLDLPRVQRRKLPSIRSAHAGVGSDTDQPVGEWPAAIRLNMLKMLFLVITVCAIGLIVVRPSRSWLNWYLTLAWSIYVPMHLLGLFATIHLRVFHGGFIGRSTFGGSVDNLVIFVIPSLCRADTTNALKRVITSIVERAPRNLSNYRIDVITEEGLPGEEIPQWLDAMPRVRTITVPKAYKTPRGARFKARANHYAM